MKEKKKEGFSSFILDSVLGNVFNFLNVSFIISRALERTEIWFPKIDNNNDNIKHMNMILP